MSYQEFSVEFIEPEEFDDFSRTDTEDSDSVENMEDEELDVDIDNDGSRNSSSVSQAMWDILDSSSNGSEEPNQAHVDLIGLGRSQSRVLPESNLQSMDLDISQQPSCSTSAQNIKEPQTSSTSANTNDSENTDEAFSCSICLDGLTSSGDHRPACLKCGHIFGEQCIIRWIKTGCNSDARRCPTCNTKASLKDIRILFAKKLVAVDTALLTDLQNKLEREVKKNISLTNESHALIERAECLSNENLKLKTLLSGCNVSPNAPTTKRSLMKNIRLCKNSECRVMTYNKMNMMLVVSQKAETSIFNNQIIRKMNASLMMNETLIAPPEEKIYVHSKQIRDMSFHPIEHHVLVSVGLDKNVNLLDMTSNAVISDIELDEPLWSCCWAGDNSNVLVTGGQTGTLFYIDKRVMKVFHSEHKRTPACVSLVSIPPSSTRVFPKGGFLRTRMDLLSMFEASCAPNFYQETELPVRGVWSCASYDARYNHILLSSKPCGNNKVTRHIVSKLSSLNEDSLSLQPVVTFYGGDKATQLTRSCFVPAKEPYDETLVAYFDEKSNCIQLCSLNSNSSVHKFSVQEPILDLCYLDGLVMNRRRVIAALSAKSISIYCV